MTMSADEARRSVATRVAERDLIITNMHALYGSVGMKAACRPDPDRDHKHNMERRERRAGRNARDRYQVAVRRFRGQEDP
jgi:hypothetical protein